MSGNTLSEQMECLTAQVVASIVWVNALALITANRGCRCVP